jgi:hypothetical protein
MQYAIYVTKNGKFLFSTEKQPGSSADKEVEQVILEITSRFRREFGFRVDLVEWQTQLGNVADVTQ